MGVVSQEPLPRLWSLDSCIRSLVMWVCSSRTPLSGSPGDGLNGSRKERHSGAQTPMTVSKSCKLKAVHATTTRKDGGAWHTVGTVFLLNKLLRKTGRFPFFALPLIMCFLLLDIHFLSCSAFFFPGPLTKCTDYENLEFFAGCAGVSYA